MNSPSNLYTVGQISKLCNIPIQTLHYYDREEVLKPEVRDAKNNYRFYSEKQLVDILLIKELKSLGFSLETIKKFTRAKDLLNLKLELEAKQKEIEDNIRNLQKQLHVAVNNANIVINGLKLLESSHLTAQNNREKSYHIELKKIPQSLVVFTRYRSKCNAAELFLERYAELQRVREGHHLFTCEPLTAVFHEHYTTQFFAHETDLEVCLPLVEEKKGCPAVKEFGGFLAATTIHVGGYRDALPGYLAIVEWIKHHGFAINGPAIEEYIIGPLNTDYESNYVTRIMLPVEKLENKDY